MRIGRRLALCASSLVMMLTLCLGSMTAYAEETDNMTAYTEETGNGIPMGAMTTGKITVVNNTNSTHVSITGRTFSAYKLFDLVQDSTHKAFGYKVNDKFRGLFEGRVSDITSDDEIRKYMESLTVSADIEAFAKAALEYAQSKGISPDKTAQGNYEKAVFSRLPLGYYLITGGGMNEAGETVVSAVILDSTTFDKCSNEYCVAVDVKMSVPTCDKEITNADNKDFTSVNIGDTVEFAVNTIVPDITGYTAYSLALDDTMSAGLSYDEQNGIKVTIGDTEIQNTEGQNDKYTVSADGQQITAKFDKNWFYGYIYENSIPVGTPIKFEYRATLNKNAVMGSNGNPNTAHIEYSSNPYTEATAETVSDTVNVYTYEIDVFKFTEGRIPLANAVFCLYRNEQLPENLLHFSDKYIYDESSENTEVVSDGRGNIKIKGLKAGKYILEEKTAPIGYNRLEAPVILEIKEDSARMSITNSYLTAERGSQYAILNGECGKGDKGIKTEVINLAGREFPSTGGRGVFVVYAAGGVLIISAALLFVIKRVAKNRK